MKKGLKKFLWGMLGFLALCLILIGIGILISEVGDKMAKSKPAPAERQEMTAESCGLILAWEYKGYYIPSDHPMAESFIFLVDYLSSRYVENPERISDYTIVTHELLRDAGIWGENLLTIMTGLSTMQITEPNPKYQYYASAFVTLRKKGFSRDDALSRIETFIRSNPHIFKEAK